MYYRHNYNYVYQERLDEHIITIKYIIDIDFDENHH